MLTGGTVSDGDCNTSDGGCCDLVPECRDDGTCQLPPPVCTTDSTCGGADEVCARGLACVSPDDVEITSYEPGSSPYLGVVQYDSREFFLVGTGDISSGSSVINEVVTFEPAVGANVHIDVDGSGRPLSAYVEGNEEDVITVVYDDNGNLVSAIGADGDNRRALETVPRLTSVLQDGTGRKLLPVIIPGIILGGLYGWHIMRPFIMPLFGESTYSRIVGIHRLLIALSR